MQDPSQNKIIQESGPSRLIAIPLGIILVCVFLWALTPSLFPQEHRKQPESTSLLKKKPLPFKTRHQAPQNPPQQEQVDMFMGQLQREIRANWHPPESENSKTIVAFFTIRPNGEIENLRVKQSSNNAEADQKALEAIRNSAPFPGVNRLGYTPPINIEFQFDYNVFQDGKKTTKN